MQCHRTQLITSVCVCHVLIVLRRSLKRQNSVRLCFVCGRKIESDRWSRKPPPPPPPPWSLHEHPHNDGHAGPYITLLHTRTQGHVHLKPSAQACLAYRASVCISVGLCVSACAFDVNSSCWKKNNSWRYTMWECLEGKKYIHKHTPTNDLSDWLSYKEYTVLLILHIRCNTPSPPPSPFHPRCIFSIVPLPLSSHWRSSVPLRPGTAKPPRLRRSSRNQTPPKTRKWDWGRHVDPSQILHDESSLRCSKWSHRALYSMYFTNNGTEQIDLENFHLSKVACLVSEMN